MAVVPGPAQRINLFSLVAYIPDPLGTFIDRLRQELVPECNLRAHVTILPPRPLIEPPEAAAAHVRSMLREFAPFEAHLNEVEIFTMSSVVHLALTTGFVELCRLHHALNNGPAQFCEPYPYHPHVTLAQQITPEQIPAVFELARYRWAEYPQSRCFSVEKATFVQATSANTWIDLEDSSLGPESKA